MYKWTRRSKKVPMVFNKHKKGLFFSMHWLIGVNPRMEQKIVYIDVRLISSTFNLLKRKKVAWWIIASHLQYLKS